VTITPNNNNNNNNLAHARRRTALRQPTSTAKAAERVNRHTAHSCTVTNDGRRSAVLCTARRRADDIMLSRYRRRYNAITLHAPLQRYHATGTFTTLSRYRHRYNAITLPAPLERYHATGIFTTLSRYRRRYNAITLQAPLQRYHATGTVTTLSRYRRRYNTVTLGVPLQRYNTAHTALHRVRLGNFYMHFTSKLQIPTATYFTLCRNTPSLVFVNVNINNALFRVSCKIGGHTGPI